MSVTGVSNDSYAAALQSGTDRVPQKTLGQAEFFRLISVQFAAQDPLKPMDDTSFIAQLANFSALENSTKLTEAFSQFTSQQQFASAQGLLGREVTLLDPNDTEVTGTVSSVRNNGADTLITVNGADYAVSSVRRVDLTSNPSTSN